MLRRIHTSNRQNARERDMERRVRIHPAGLVRYIARRISYPAAVRLTRECRADGNARVLYVPSVSDGYNVVELEAK